MTATTSTKLGIPYIASQQATPEITHNEALLLLEALTRGVKDKDLSAPPGAPADGDTYIIGAAPTGAWAGRVNCIAVYVTNQWRFVPGDDSTGTPIVLGATQEGLNVWVQDENLRYTWTGSTWSSAPGIAASDVSFTPTGTIAANNVQAAIAEAASEAVQIAGHAAVSVLGRSANTTGDAADIAAAGNGQYFRRQTNALAFATIPATDVVNTPAGNIAATEVQVALNELDAEKAKLAGGNTFTGTQVMGLITLAAGGKLSSVSGATPDGNPLDITSDSNLAARFTTYSTNNLGGGLTGRKGHGSIAAPTAVTSTRTCWTTAGQALNGSAAMVSVGQMLIKAIGDQTTAPLGAIVFDTSNGSALNVTTILNGDGSWDMAPAELRHQAAGQTLITSAGNLRRGRAYTVATLPSASGQNGAMAYVTDATVAFGAATIGLAATGGGANHAPVIVVNGAWVYG